MNLFSQNSKRRAGAGFTIALLSFASVFAADAQEAKARASLATNDIIWVGQKVTLVVELLAPGLFNSAATFDLPDPPGMLLLPAMDDPVVSSEQIGDAGYTVQRYELSVFAKHAGAQTIPPLTIRFAFKRQPLDSNDVPATVKTEPLQFTAALPPGMESPGNVISARDLKIVEGWKPEPGKTTVKTGDAFTRTITFTAPEVPGMVFPPFPTGKIDDLGIYVKREVRDQIDRGALSGERRDTITYVCQRPGRFTIPAARLVWWNVDTRQLCTNEFPARTIDVAPNPALASAATAPAGATGPGWFARPGTKWTATGLELAILLVLIVVWNPSARRILAEALAELRPVHLEPLNPPEQN